MKLKRKIIALTMSAVFTISMATTAFAEAPPHLMYGTEKTYGEDKTQYGALYQHVEGSDDDFANVGAQYAILPQNDTFSFDKADSNINPSHDVVVEWWCPDPYQEGEKVALFWEGSSVKSEKFEFGKEYPVFPAEVQERVAKVSTEDYGYYRSMNANEPFIILTVTDRDLAYKWWWVYQVVDNWNAPNNVTNTDTTNADSQAAVWKNNAKGWWIQNADGTYLTNSWYQSPESGLWYYMGADGYMLTNTTTPDGYTVNADGVWIQ